MKRKYTLDPKIVKTDSFFQQFSQDSPEKVYFSTTNLEKLFYHKTNSHKYLIVAFKTVKRLKKYLIFQFSDENLKLTQPFQLSLTIHNKLRKSNLEWFFTQHHLLISKREYSEKSGIAKNVLYKINFIKESEKPVLNEVSLVGLLAFKYEYDFEYIYSVRSVNGG